MRLIEGANEYAHQGQHVQAVLRQAQDSFRLASIQRPLRRIGFRQGYLLVKGIRENTHQAITFRPSPRV